MILRINENMTPRQVVHRNYKIWSLWFFLMSMALLIMAILLSVAGCAKAKPEPAYPERTPIADRVAEQTILPDHQAPRGDTQVAPVAQGDAVPFDGILLDENGALAAAELRVSYDEVYKLAQVDRKFAVTVTQILEQELNRADQTIKIQRDKLTELRDSWWARNKVVVGIGIGVIVGAGLVIGAGYAWASIEEEKVTE